MLKNKTALSLSPLALLTLAACGGTSGSSVSAVSGKVQKGPLENAEVYLDYDRDGVFDSTDSAKVITNAAGAYSITPTSSVYNVVAVTTAATIDESTGATTGAGITLQAPKGSSVVTPMTTMVQNLITADEALATPLGVTAASASGDVAAAMGFTAAEISAGFDPMTYDAYAAGADAGLALKAEKTSQKIMTVVNSFAAAGEAAGATAAESFAASFTALANVVKTTAAGLTAGTAGVTTISFDLADIQAIKVAAATTMASAKDAGGNVINTAAVNNFTAAAAQAEAAIVNVSAAIELVTDITDTADAFQVIAALETQVAAAAVAVVKVANGVALDAGETITLGFATNSAVTAAVANKAPTDIVLKDALGAAITTVSIAEDANSLVVVASMGTTDATVGDTHVYTIAAGLDGALFTINATTGALSLITQPDYEAMLAAGSTSYSVAVTSTDTGGAGKSITETITVSVTDVAESGAFGISSDTVTWTDYNPATSADISNSFMTTTTGAQVAMGTGSMRMNQTNLLNFTDADNSTVGKSPTLSFTLDSLPTGTGIATVTATVIEGTDGTRSGTEDMISLTVNVAYNNGTISMPAGTATGSLDKGDGTSVSFTLDNPTVHAFTIGTTTTSTGTALPTLDVKLGNLYQAFTDGAGSAEVLHTGTYSIAIETTLPLQNTANETVTKFTGSLELVTSTAKGQIYGTDGADTITGTSAAEVIVGGAGKDTITTGGGIDHIVMHTGFGSTTLANANTVSDFTNGTDLFALDGLTFAELTVAADATTAADTVISITATSEYLMTVTGVAHGYFDTDDFVAVATIA